MVRNGEYYRIVSDNLGSVRLVVKLDGTVMQRMNYNEYGIVTEEYYFGEGA